MINPIINLLNARLDALTWIERRGGVVQLATKTTTANDGVRTEHRFPITPDAYGRTCLEKGRYYDMLPNTRLKAVTYWEQTNDMQLGDPGPKRNRNVFTGRVRLVGWLNAPALGVEDTQVPFSAEAAVLNALVGGKQEELIATGPLDGVGYDLRIVSVVRRSPDIFRAYTMPENVLMYPLDYFAIDFDLRVSVPVSCLAFVPAAGVCEDHEAPDAVPAPSLWDWEANVVTGGFIAGFSQLVGYTEARTFDGTGLIEPVGTASVSPAGQVFNGLYALVAFGTPALTLRLFDLILTGLSGVAEIDGVEYPIVDGFFKYNGANIDPTNASSPIYWPAPYGQEIAVKIRID